MSDLVREGRLEWTGDNPFIYLKTDLGGDWSSLSLHFRIAASPHGFGEMILVVVDPYQPVTEQSSRTCLTDNVALARYLLEEFVADFALFRPVKGLNEIAIMGNAVFTTNGQGTDEWEVQASCAQGRSVTLRWEGLGDAFVADVGPAASATGRHEMLSVFRTAGTAVVELDGQRLPGKPVLRNFLGRGCVSAALALSETWIDPT